MNDESEKPLKYTIHKFSSYSGIYTPEKILVDNPSDQTSRWSSESNNPPQFLILKLNSPAIVTKITFGKFDKPHVCNLKRFTIYGSLTENGYAELFSGGLKNDSHPETFPLRYILKDHSFPCLYIKIVPIQSWAVSFNFSIWYLELKGVDDEFSVSEAVSWLKKYREREAIRLCLKHLRQSNYLDVFDLLQRRSGVELEHFLLSKIHESLVIEGNFEKTEQFIVDAAENGAFDEYVARQTYAAEWSPIVANEIKTSNLESSLVVDADRSPGMRGGHQMVIDAVGENIYLFGGWDGYQDLSDFWSFNVANCQWTCISNNTETDGGPTPRSCHKMVFDPVHRRIFCLGRYVEANSRVEVNLKNDFYVYNVDSNAWNLICDDTYGVGGPKLIFDHQMVIDQDREIIYCFGGRILSYIPPTTDDRKLLEQQFSGLFAYHIPTDSWALLRDDRNEPTPSPGYIRSRIGHSMLFHQPTRSLYIFAGQRVKDYLTDMFIYRVDRDEIEMIVDHGQKPSQGDKFTIPAAGFTQRATIDVDLNEIYVFSGLSKDREKKDDCVQNSFWVYNITLNTWSCVYQNDGDNERNEVPSKLHFAVGMKSQRQLQEPCPRYAHQLVYDNIRKVHYLFGGNPGKSSLIKIRLDDFWLLKLRRPSKIDIVNKCKFALRKCKFSEMLRQNAVSALNYLQNHVSQLITGANDEETAEFHHLAALVFEYSDETAGGGDKNNLHEMRNGLFNELSAFFSEDKTPPKENLLDLIPI